MVVAPLCTCAAAWESNLVQRITNYILSIALIAKGGKQRNLYQHWCLLIDYQTLNNTGLEG